MPCFGIETLNDLRKEDKTIRVSDGGGSDGGSTVVYRYNNTSPTILHNGQIHCPILSLPSTWRVQWVQDRPSLRTRARLPMGEVRPVPIPWVGPYDVLVNLANLYHRPLHHVLRLGEVYGEHQVARPDSQQYPRPPSIVRLVSWRCCF